MVSGVWNVGGAELAKLIISSTRARFKGTFGFLLLGVLSILRRARWGCLAGE